MKRPALLSLALFAVPLTAQQTTLNVTLPRLNPVPRTSGVPFQEQRVRYQQWYEAAQFRPQIARAVRIIGIEFLGSLPAGTRLDIEVTMAHGSSNLSGVFRNNLVSNVVRVIPRRQVPITGPTTRLDFVNHWQFDGMSNVVTDIKIFGNSANARLNFAGRSTVLTSSNTKRQFFIGNASAATANSPGATGHYGLMTRFLFQEGGTYEYGSGCPGARNIVPEGSASAVPLPGDATYTQLLTKANGGFPAVWVLGISDSTWSGANLPFPLRFLNAANCSLNASAEVLVFTRTGGGGPGTGTARLLTPIPGIRALAGAQVYSQWIIFDRGAPNGELSATRGLRHFVGR